MPTIDYAELERMLADPDVPDSEVRPYLKAERRPGSAFDPRVVPDPAKVRMDTLDRFRVESAIRWGNGISRWRRQRRYERRLEQERGRTPVLVSEGDSWFQFPLLIDDVVDQLGRDHLIWSLDAAGDTAQNMILSRPEYLEGLRERRADGIAGFLFSAAGNDVIGEDATGKPVLLQLLKQHQPGQGAAAHVDHARLAAILSFLEEGYGAVIRQIHAEPGFATLPILLHGYDYALPFGQPGDARNPGWAAPDEWLAGPMRQKGIQDPDLQRNIVRLLIDALYDMLDKVAGDSRTTHVHVVDVRRTLTNVGQWADEIHATDRGFAKIADLFRTKLREAGIVAGAA
jgi:hypothetical protein